MDNIQVDVLPGVESILASADCWNDLWARSSVQSPTSRAEPTAQWLKAFASDQRYETVVVRQGGRWLAALPLVATSWGRIVQAAGLPRNEWSESGDLLVDSGCDLPRALDAMAGRLASLDWPVYRFAFVRSQSRSWQTLIQAMTKASMAVDCRTMYPVAVFPTPDAEVDVPTASKSLRKKLRRAKDQLRAIGKLEWTWHVPTNIPQKQSLLTRALAIEHTSWKGREGTSVLSQPGMAHYLQSLTDSLVQCQMVEFVFLELNDQPIAFELLWRAKDTLHSYKVGYDERFRAFQPGNVLLHGILRDMAQNRRAHLYDALGPATEGLLRFGGRVECVSRVTAAPRRLLGRALIELYRNCWPAAVAPDMVATPTTRMIH